VFTDIDCGYCRKLHSEIASYNARGITVRYLSFPRAGPNSPSFNRAASVWCSEDRNDALTRAKAGENVPARKCDNPVSEHYNLGVAMGVRGTPAILLESGALMPGYMPANKLVRELDRKRKEKS
jgi:thiol:disulfide interchange protein DsbC